MTFSKQFLMEVQNIATCIDTRIVDRMASILADIRSNKGRLFILGVGGSAGNASHATNDFRKLANLETYSPCDNVSELTSRTNDEGWDNVFVQWLKASHLSNKDALLIFSVGGGNLEKNISVNLVLAMQLARAVESKILAIVGRHDGYAVQVADECLIIPTVNPEHITPHSESFQAVLWHLLVSHPLMKKEQTKWESLTSR